MHYALFALSFLQRRINVRLGSSHHNILVSYINAILPLPFARLQMFLIYDRLLEAAIFASEKKIQFVILTILIGNEDKAFILSEEPLLKEGFKIYDFLL